MNLFSKPQYDDSKKLNENVKNLFNGVSKMVEQMNRERSTGNAQIVYSGTTSSGTAAVPLETICYSLFIAIIGGVPTLAVQYGGVIAARGGDKANTRTLTGTIKGTTFTFDASDTLDKLIVLL